MPVVALVLLVVAVVGSIIFLTVQVKVELRRRRNLKRVDSNEPLEGEHWD